MTTQTDKAERLLQLHQSGRLLLPNAWDVGSARIFEAEGFPAIATTSAGVAFAQGYPDGQRIGRDEMLAIVARIAAAVQVPVTADVEAGYGHAPADVAETMRAVVASGAVGVNLEDNNGTPDPLYPLDVKVARLKAARAQADGTGIHLVINARIDTYLLGAGKPETRFDETIRRANAYLGAGVDSIFVPGVVDVPTVQALVQAIPAPLNILAGAGAPSAPELFALGVKRISVGSSPMLATMGLTRAIARELHTQGTYENIAAYPYSYREAMQLLAKR
jgi:2-methylisocitrate lyase-like PEP mutase family enzyme